MQKSFGDRSVSVAAPTLWNALRVSLRNNDSIFKTDPFKLAFSLQRLNNN